MPAEDLLSKEKIRHMHLAIAEWEREFKKLEDEHWTISRYQERLWFQREMHQSKETLLQRYYFINLFQMAKQKTQSSLTVLQVVDKWKLNRGLLASKMGMPKGTFNNKLNPTHASQFSNEENIKLIGVLREMSVDIDSVTDIDFNDALKALTGGK